VSPKSNEKYSRVFNRLCHLVALSKEGKAKGAIDNLMLAVLSIDRELAASTATELGLGIDAYFGLTFSERVLQASIDRHLSSGRMLRNRQTKVLSLNPDVSSQIARRIKEANELEAQVRDEWLASLEVDIRKYTPAEKAKLWSCLTYYMAKAFQRHGVETALMLDPTQRIGWEDKKTLSTYLEEAIKEHCKDIAPKDVAEAVQHFFITTSAIRTKYIAQLLDGTFTFFALSVDETTVSYLTAGISRLSLFLDTNFIFGILGLHSDSLNDVTQELITLVKKYNLPFKLFYHEETLRELQGSIRAVSDYLRGRTWPQALSRAAVKSRQLRGIELRYHELNSQTPIDPEIFLSKYQHITELLDDKGLQIYRAQPSNDQLDEEKFRLIAEYKHFIETHRPWPKKYEALNHDMVVWQTVHRLRAKNSSFFDAGSFFLTVDFFLYRFDWQQLRQHDDIGVVALPNQILQLLRPLIPTTDDFDRRFVEVFGIPEFRTAGGDYSTTGSKVLSYLNSYADVSEQTALRILGNEVLMHELRESESEPEEFKALVDNALAQDNVKLAQERDQFQLGALEAHKRADENEAVVREKDDELFRAMEAQRLLEDEKARAAQTATITGEKALEAERRAEQAESKLRTQEDDIASLRVASRFGWGLLVAVAGFVLIFLVPMIWPWQWLATHPRKIGLYFSASLLVSGVSWLIVDPKRRKYAAVPLIIGAILLVGQLI
jgi:hypothetical protein